MGRRARRDRDFESVSDGLNVVGTVAEGTAGADGVVTFTIRHPGGGPESVVAIAWQDLNDDNDPEITGNSPPLEPYAAGGRTDFMAGILPDCGGPGSGFAPISGVDTAANRIEVFGICSVYYDGNDSFSIEGVPATMAAFEAALNPGDEITGISLRPHLQQSISIRPFDRQRPRHRDHRYDAGRNNSGTGACWM